MLHLDALTGNHTDETEALDNIISFLKNVYFSQNAMKMKWDFITCSLF